MILMNDFRREAAPVKEAMAEAMARVAASGWYILGPEVEGFESEWAAYVEAKHCIGVANGMDALEIGLRALGIGPGDEVVTTGMTAFATVLAVMRTGAEPVFADIDPETAILDPRSVERCLSTRTKAVLVVHIYGQAAPLDVFDELCRTRGIHLVEDCAQAHGAKFQGRPVGSWGSFAAWSFYPTKNLGCMGDGGAITTNSAALADSARMLRNYGQSKRYEHPVAGLNSRLDELQAAILRARLRHLPEWTEARRAIARTLQATISNPRVRVLRASSDRGAHVHHLFVLTCDERTAFKIHLEKCGVESLIHYPIPGHQQIPGAGFRSDPHGLPNTGIHAANCLSIPVHPHLHPQELSSITQAVNGF